MNALSEIKNRFKPVLDSMVDDSADLLSMIRPARDERFGDYQANCAMPLKDRLGKPAREIAADMVSRLQIEDLCQTVDVAGPGFINLTLDDGWLRERLAASYADDRLGVAKTREPRTFIVDFSSPNVAKPMHVGHIRSTVIGDAIARILRYAGHHVVTDNHLGDWGTQFGMIIYGYKHFVDEPAYRQSPIQELGRLYQLVRRLIDYQEAVTVLPEAETRLADFQSALPALKTDPQDSEPAAAKKRKKERQLLQARIHEQQAVVDSLSQKIDSVRRDSQWKELADSHPDIAARVLDETAMLHAGDEENQRLWNEFLPHGLEDIQRIYDRLGVQFDFALGESHYHGELADLVADLKQKELARESEGAICVFLDGFDAPMLIQKKDGAFLYATTDLATIRHRVEQWNADVILYVVDHRQHEHFDKLFDAAAKWGYDRTTFTHVSFGTVLGEDGRPFKTRSGDTVGLAGLLDEAEQRAGKIAVEQNPDLSDAERDRIAHVIGIGGLKYVDLSQNRLSDYKFSYDKMLALKGNTATYLQYSYARVQGILRKGDVDVQRLRSDPVPFVFEDDIERKLALNLNRFGEAIDEVLINYKPNLLTSYLFELTQVFFQFYDRCPVLKTEDEMLRKSRLQLSDLTARTIKTGLSLLGIDVVEKM